MKRLTCLLISMLILAACKKDKAPDASPNDTPGHISGMGDAPGELMGTPFQLPSNIELKDSIRGEYDVDATGYCLKSGSGAFVLVQLNLVNHAQKDTFLILPAGLTIHAEDKAFQHGLLIQKTTIPLAKGASCKVLLLTYCVNSNRQASNPHCSYTFGPVTNSKPLLELIDLLKNKRINYEDLQDHNWEDNLDLQDAVWEVTDQEGLTKESKDFFSSLPGF